MHNALTSPFFSELLDRLKQDVAARIQANELDPSDAAGTFQKLIEEALLSKAALSLPDIIEKYQSLFAAPSAFAIERKLLEAFKPREYALKIYRGLPRLYHRGNPSKSRVKPEFAHLPILKRLAAERFIFPLYEKRELPANAKVTLFTWVISDGWGDWVAAKESLRILRERLANVTFQWVALVPKSYKVPEDEAICIPYEKEISPEEFSQEALQALRSSDAILSLPTFYPKTKELLDYFSAKAGDAPVPSWISVGEYGYLESSWFHPKSGNRSMGLHFLEKGILIRGAEHANFASLENEKLLRLLFGTTMPGPQEIENYLDTRKFYLAYLTSGIGGSVYLHALLRANERDDQPIDICTIDIGWFVAHVERQNKEGKPVIEGNFKVEQIEVHFEGKIHKVKIAPEGKKLRILCPGDISDADFRLLVRLSGEFVGVRGNQSLSEAVSANRAFFYDGAAHSRYFVKDLLAIAENRLAQNRSALAIFRGMGKAFLHNIPAEEGEWVEETHFQEKEPWLSIALSIGSALKDPDAIASFKKFNRILGEEHSFNGPLVHLVRRALIHRANPALALEEEKGLALFSTGAITLPSLIASLEKK